MRSNIKELAEAKYPTLAAFCKAADITPEAVYKWERRGLANARLCTMLRVAKALDCDIHDLYEA